MAHDIGEQAIFVKHDVTSEDGWAAVIERTLQTFGTIDILINNAALTYFNTIDKTTKAQLDMLLSINVMARSWA